MDNSNSIREIYVKANGQVRDARYYPDGLPLGPDERTTRDKDNNSDSNDIERRKDERAAKKLDLIIANGGAGQSGLLGFLCHHFLMESVHKDLCIGYHCSNTHGSHLALAAGIADIGIVYDAARVVKAVEAGEVDEKRVVNAFSERFCIIGPDTNPAGIEASDSIETAILKIMKSSGAQLLTRFDFSTAHVKEAHVVAEVANRVRERVGLSRLDPGLLNKMLVAEGFLELSPEMRNANKERMDAYISDWEAVERMQELDFKHPSCKQRVFGLLVD